jgi:hypothetical protein
VKIASISNVLRSIAVAPWPATRPLTAKKAIRRKKVPWMCTSMLVTVTSFHDHLNAGARCRGVSRRALF